MKGPAAAAMVEEAHRKAAAEAGFSEERIGRRLVGMRHAREAGEDVLHESHVRCDYEFALVEIP